MSRKTFKTGCIVIFLVFGWIALQSFVPLAKTYQVIKVKGTVKNLTKGKSLVVKQRFSAQDKLKFSSQEDRLAVIDETKRTYIIKPNKDLISYQAQPIRAKFNTRPGEILTYISFVKYLEGRDFLILGDQVKLKIEAPDLKLDDQHFFYIRYALEGDSSAINKKLSSEGNQVIISKTELFTVDEQTVKPEQASEFELFYYNQAETKSLKINDLSLVFPDSSELRDEIDIILSSFENTTPKPQELKKTIENYLIEVYGVPEEENLRQWLASELGL